MPCDLYQSGWALVINENMHEHENHQVKMTHLLLLLLYYKHIFIVVTSM